MSRIRPYRVGYRPENFYGREKIDVAINLHRIQPDNYGNLYVSSRGDYYEIPSKTFIIDTSTDEVTYEFEDLPNTHMTLCRDSLFLYSTEWSYLTNDWTVSYALVNTRTREIVTRNFIKDGSKKRIRHLMESPSAQTPESFWLPMPKTRPCRNPAALGRTAYEKWSISTGNIPAHIVFTHKKLQPLEE